MSKVTEQDLIKLGFIEKLTFNKRKFFEIHINNKLLGTIEIYVSFIDNLIKLWADLDCISITRELTHDNLDLSIKFADGDYDGALKELAKYDTITDRNEKAWELYLAIMGNSYFANRYSMTDLREMALKETDEFLKQAGEKNG